MTVRIATDAPEHELVPALLTCCGSERWARGLSERFPLETMPDLHEAADAGFAELEEPDWLEAFGHHPRIGDVEDLRARFAASGALSELEQRGIGRAAEDVLAELARGNAEYERRFGFVFLVRAAGRSAREVLELQRLRLEEGRGRDEELAEAAGQQREIAHLRLATTFVEGHPTGSD